MYRLKTDGGSDENVYVSVQRGEDEENTRLTMYGTVRMERVREREQYDILTFQG